MEHETPPGFFYGIILMSSMERKTQQGMTLVELVIIIVVLSILVSIASVRLNNSAAMTTAHQADLFASQIRHLQSLATNWGCELNLNITTTINYTATSRVNYVGKVCNTAGAIIQDPSTSSPFSNTLTDSAQFTAIKSMGFDGLGRPINAATGVLLSADTIFDMTAGDITWRVTVLPISGFVSLVKL